MDSLTALPLAAAGFDRTLVAAGDLDLEAVTPCDGWTVRDLLVHVIAGSRMSAAILGGASRDEALAILGGTTLDYDVLSQFRAAVAEQAAAFAEPGSLERTVAHPAMDMPATQLAGFRVGDLLVHGWDLARATGGDETLDPAVVEVVWKNIEPMIPVIGSVGVFGAGPSGNVPEDSPLQERLLDAMGRRP